MELLWACLLTVGILCRATRLLSVLLVVKAVCNYLLFEAGAQWAPAFIDLLAGAVAIMCIQGRTRYFHMVVIVGFVLTCLAHAAYWTFWHDVNATWSWIYYYTVISLFTAKAAALALPGGRELGRVLRRMGFSGRRRVAGLARNPERPPTSR